MILRKVVLITAPQLAVRPDKIITWTGVSNQTYTVQSSSNLVTWVTDGFATSSSNDFCFTNTSDDLRQFFRVAYP